MRDDDNMDLVHQTWDKLGVSAFRFTSATKISNRMQHPHVLLIRIAVTDDNRTVRCR